MKLKLLLTGILAIALPLALFTACSRTMKDGPLSAQNTVQKYTCPMHPNYVKDKPGECPICGMNLVPVEDDIEAVQGEHQHEGAPKGVDGLSSVKITPEKQQLIGVTTAAAEWRDVSKLIRTVGTVAYDPDLYAAQQEYIGALKTYAQAKSSASDIAKESARSLLNASKTRLKLMGLSDEQINGFNKNSKPDASLLLPQDSKKAWIYAAVYEDDMMFVKKGQKAVVTAPSAGAQSFEGEVVAIDPVIDPETRSARARILIGKRSPLLRPESFVNVEINVPLGNLLTVPANAVMNTGTRQVVYVKSGENIFDPREVEISFKTDDYYVVREGIEEGDVVVTNANFLIDSESQLKATMKNAAGGHKH